MGGGFSGTLELPDEGDEDDEEEQEAATSSSSMGSDRACELPPSKITDSIYVGTKHHAKDGELLRQLGISHVLNVTTRVPNFFEASRTLLERGTVLTVNGAECNFSPENDEPIAMATTSYSPTKASSACIASLKYLRVPSEDVPEDVAIIAHMPQIAYFIDEAEASGGRVFIHCEQGISRSPTAAIAYLTHPARFSLREALSIVKEKRPEASVNHGFFDQLRYYEIAVRGEPTVNEYDYGRFFSKRSYMRFEDVDFSLMEEELAKEFRLDQIVRSCCIS